MKKIRMSKTILLKICTIFILLSILPMVALAADPVRIQDGDSFPTLEDAIAAANVADFSTIEIMSDVIVTNNLTVTSDIIIIGADGAHTVTMSPKSIQVKNGGSLTLGDGTVTNPLTIKGSVRVTDGRIEVNDGITIIGSLDLNGSSARGSIRGGTFEGYTPLNMSNGSYLSEISGGVFKGAESSAHIAGQGTRIDFISGGTFIKTDPGIDRGNFYLESGPRIGEISGGTFDGNTRAAIMIMRGSWIDEISGGEFLAENAINLGAITVFSESSTQITGIGTISGGLFKGGPVSSGTASIGVWIYGNGARINTITNGTFIGERGLSTEPSTVVYEITGGKFEGVSSGTRGNYGIFNAGTIEYIGGEAEIIGRNAGIWNWPGSRIDEIGGGNISSTGAYTFGYAITNSGTISKISGGTFIGEYNAISSSGRLNEITDGVFYSKSSQTITLSYPLKLEPGLSAEKGAGRYRSGNGQIFNNEALVVYPDSYFMSVETEPVAGIDSVVFRFLTTDKYIIEYELDGGVNAPGNPESYIKADCPVDITDPTKNGYTFDGWTVEYENGTSAFPEFDYVILDGTTGNITLTAAWKERTPDPKEEGGKKHTHTEKEQTPPEEEQTPSEEELTPLEKGQTGQTPSEKEQTPQETEQKQNEGKAHMILVLSFVPFACATWVRRKKYETEVYSSD